MNGRGQQDYTQEKISETDSLKTKKLKRAQSIVGVSKGRPEGDFYITPVVAVEELLYKENFFGSIWEPACGTGAISEYLKEAGFKSVFSTDLINRGYGQVRDLDFLTCEKATTVDNIITNPPYSLATKFAYRALELSKHKVALLCKIQFLNGQERKELFTRYPLARVLVFSYRLTMWRNGIKPEKGNTGMMDFAWFIWDKEYTGPTIIRWI